MNVTTANNENMVTSTLAAEAPISVSVIVIGRNEGQRLINCLKSLSGQVETIIYVDSGSTDNSIENARQLGAEIVNLDRSVPFTAARARNTGLKHLRDSRTETTFVQFVDGDCEIEPGWIETARQALVANPRLAIVAGRRRERYPERTVYNQICDTEWNTPIGLTDAVGGDLMARTSDLLAIGGYRNDMIAGEEPEMCLRLKRNGGLVERLDAPMTIHDADIRHFSQWWRRARRAGHAFAEGNWLHGACPEAMWRTETRRAILWALIIPLLILIAALFLTPWALFGALLYPLQILRIARRDKKKPRTFAQAFFLTLSKFPEAFGIADFYAGQLLGNKRKIIEYK